jgi:tetratricopeptide (TPR) repeat protein
MRETNAAIAAFRRAIDLSPRFSDAYFGLAESYRARGNKIYAIRYYKQYLDIAPHGPDSDVARSQLTKLEDDNSSVPTPPPAPQPSQPEPPPPPPAPSP